MKPHHRPWFLTPEAGIYWLAGVGFLLAAAGLVGVIRIVRAENPPPPAVAAAAPARLASTLTPTPFQPAQPTPTSLPAATAVPTPTPTSPPAPHFAEALLSDSTALTTLEIDPGESVNQGRPILLSFLPGPACDFGTGAACLSRHQHGDLVMLTIHSGLGGQGENFRRAVEGTGLDSAFFSLARIHANLEALRGAPARLTGGSGTLEGLELVGVARVPPERLQEYFSLPGDAALALAAEYDPQVKAALDSGEQLLAFEVCGWAVPGEAWAPGVSATSASIYVGFIRDH